MKKTKKNQKQPKSSTSSSPAAESAVGPAASHPPQATGAPSKAPTTGDRRGRAPGPVSPEKSGEVSPAPAAKASEPARPDSTPRTEAPPQASAGAQGKEQPTAAKRAAAPRRKLSTRVPRAVAADLSTVALREPSLPAPAEDMGRERPRFRVLMVAPEALPFSKSGGLGDVTGGLPRALARLGHDVTLVIPRYHETAARGRTIGDVQVDLGARSIQASVAEHDLEPGARVWFLEQPELFDREFLYAKGNEDYPDNALRFAFLSKAALAFAARHGGRYDIVHANDWQTGLVPLYLRQAFGAETAFADAASVFAIHNLAYQGLFDKQWLTALGLGWEFFTAEGIEFWDRISLLKAGINFADRLTTVSPRYAQEIQAPATGLGFDGIVRRRAGLLTGILNGIDIDTWNPATDPHIPRPYAADDLAGKRDAKRALLEAFGLPVNDHTMTQPVIGMVSRMVDQKGLDLIAAISADLPHLGASIVVMGTGEERYQEMWRHLAAAWPDRIAVNVGFDEHLSHLVEAGADLWLMPSRFEPCGLNQMYSQRYGTLPLVHATGGLADTVENFDEATGTGTGFAFYTYDAPSLLATLRWALSVYRNRDAWARLQLRAMRKDYSWHRAATAYAETYAQAAATRQANRVLTV